jgi:uncharacterized protein YciI
MVIYLRKHGEVVRDFSMEFDRFTVGLLILRADAPKLSEEEENALQDAHMAHLAKLHDEGILLAAGPLLGSSDRDIRGLEIYRGSPEQVKVLADQDPGVRAGRYTHRFLPWMVPGGAVSFARARFPRSMAEV